MSAAKKILLSELTLDLEAVKIFWNQVHRRDGRDCWQWMGTLTSRGYGRFRYNGDDWPAHRVAWQHANGSIPPKMMLRHRRECNNRGCVRHSHVDLVSERSVRSRGGKTTNQRDKWGQVGTRLQYLEDKPFVLHVKPGVEQLKQQLFRSREEQMIETLVHQGEQRTKLWADALEMAQSQAKAAAARESVMALELQKLREAVEQLRVLPEPDRALEPPPESGAPEPERTSTTDAPATLGEALIVLYAPVAGTLPHQLDERAEKRLLDVFDLAVQEAGGNSRGGLQVFRAWLKEWETATPPGERSLTSFERITNTSP
jgi:hypothetical protein